MGGISNAQREGGDVEHGLECRVVALGEGPAVGGLLCLVVAAWAQLPLDIAAVVASMPDCAESDRVPVHSGYDAVAPRAREEDRG